MAGGMGVKTNAHIEKWADVRQNAEYYFKFSRANWARFAVFGIAVPVGLYVAITKEMLVEGQRAGYGAERFGYERKFMGFSPPRKE